MTFTSSKHYQNYLRFISRQRNAGENVGVLRSQASQSAQAAFLKLEQVMFQLPDRVSRNLLKQLMRKSLERLRLVYRANWLNHPVRTGSRDPLQSVRAATQRTLQKAADTRGLKTRAKVGHRMKLRPRARIASILNSGKANWRVQEKTAAQIPMSAVLDDMKVVIETQFADLCRRKGFKVTL